MNKKNNCKVAFFVLCVMVLIVSFGLLNRISFEKNTKNIYLSSNYDNLLKLDVDIDDTLEMYKNAAANFVTVQPNTLFSLKERDLITTVTYSSLLINEDDISKNVLLSLDGYVVNPYSTIILSNKDEVTTFLQENLYQRYDKEKIIETVTANGIHIFCMVNWKQDEDKIIGYDKSQIEKIREHKLSVALTYPAYTFENSDYTDYFYDFLKENEVKFLILRNNKFDNKKDLSKEFTENLKKANCSLVVFENESQIHNETPYIYSQMYNAFYPDIVRGFNMDKTISYDQTYYRYRYYQWYNSALERNTTFLNANILPNENKSVIENVAYTNSALTDFNNKMKKLGYDFPTENKNADYYYNLQIATVCCGLILLLLIYIYLSFLNYDYKKSYNTVFFGLAIISMIVNYLCYDIISKYYATAIMIVTISLITLLLFKIVNNEKLKHKLLYFCTVCILGIVIGAVSITSLISNRDFFLGEKWVFGVKLTMIVPFVLTLYNYNVVFLNIKSIKEAFCKFKNSMKSIPKYVIYISAVLLILIFSYYLVRTGKSNLILPLEDKIRKLLTDVLIVRPRFKEFIIGYPSLILFFYFSVHKKSPKIRFICGILTTVLFTSVLNTFCHAFSILWVSCIRVVNGFVIGMILATIILLLINLVFMLKARGLDNKTKKISEK